MAEPQSLPQDLIARPTSRERAIRAAQTGILLTAVLYATLPFWMPTGWIQRQIVQQLTADLHRPVSITRMRLGWRSGVEVEDIRVSDHAGSPNLLLARIGRVRFAFTPLRTVLTGRVQEIEVSQAEFWVVRDEAGRLNVSDLGQKRQGRLPCLSYVLRAGACHVWTPDTRQSFRVDQLECELDPPSGLLHLFGQAFVARATDSNGPPGTGRFSLHARLKIPRLKPDEDLRGRITAEWANLSMTDLPLVLAPKLPIKQVSGATSGRLDMGTQPDLTIDYTLSISFNGVRIIRESLTPPVPAPDDVSPASESAPSLADTWAAGGESRVPDAELRCAGRWDPNPRTDVIVLREFDYETPAVHIQRLRSAPEPAVAINRDSETPFKLSIEGRVKDWPALRREFPEVDAFSKSIGLSCTGNAGFTLLMTRQREEQRATLDVDAADSAVVVEGPEGPRLRAAAGVPKKLQLQLVRNEVTRQFSQPELRASIGDVEMTLQASVDIPDPEPADRIQWLADTLPTLQADLTLTTSRLEQAVPLLPFLERIPGARTWHGPIRLSASIQPEQDASRVKTSAVFAPETVVCIGDALAKPAGETLSIDAGAVIPHRATGTLTDLWLDLNHGAARVLLDQGKARTQYAFSFLRPREIDSDVELQASLELPLHVEHTERLLLLLPVWQRELCHRGAVDGSADLILRALLTSSPGDRLLRTEVDLAADRLALRWGDLLDKPEGGPMRLTGTHTLRTTGGRHEQSLQAVAAQPFGDVSLFLTFAGHDVARPEDDFEYAGANADIRDLARMLAVTPALRRVAADVEPTGSMRCDVRSIRTGTLQALSLSCDATGSRFVIPAARPLEKPVGVGASLNLRWETDWRAPGDGHQRWRLADATAALAGARIEHLTGELVTASESARGDGLQARDMLALGGAAPRVESATLTGDGSLKLDEQTCSLHPDLRRWAKKLELGGRSEWALRLSARPDELVLTGHVDAGRTSFSIPLQTSLLPDVRKPPSGKADADFDVVLTRRPDRKGYQLTVRKAALDVGGNTIAASGDVELRRSAGSALSVGDANIATGIRLEQPLEVLRLVRGGAVDRIEGRCEADVRIVRSDAGVSLETARLRFDNFSIGAGGDPLRLNGLGGFSSSGMDAERLDWAWGRSGGAVSATVKRDGGCNVGSIGLAFDRLDIDDLHARVRELPWLDPRVAESPDFSPLLRLLADSRLVVDAHMNRVDLRLPLNVTAVAGGAATRAVLDRGPLQLGFRCMVDGGLVSGTFQTNTESRQPEFYLSYTAERIQPGQVVDAYLRLTFPGMTATGPLTLIDESTQKLLPATDDPNYPVGKGEIIIEGGSIEGRAAPVWVTRIFPGLNMARFDFSYFHSWFEKFQTGRVRHQMICHGRIYNIYTIGYSEPDGRIDYEVGIDFFADFDSKYWAEVGQGRVPLFRKTGKMQSDGRLTDEVVIYVPPQRIFSTLFLRNNPVITAYHAVRKRVLQEQ